MSMNIASDMKSVGLIGFIRLQRGGPEMSLEFRPGEYSQAITVTLDGHVVTRYLSLVPAMLKKDDVTSPNMELRITEEPITAPVAAKVAAEVAPEVKVEVAPVVKVEEPEVKVEVAPVVKAEEPEVKAEEIPVERPVSFESKFNKKK